MIDASAVQSDPSPTAPHDGTEGDETAVLWVAGHGVTVRGLDIVAPGRAPRAKGSPLNLPLVGIKVGPDGTGAAVFGNTIEDNTVGTDASGQALSPHMVGGIELNNASGNTVANNIVAGLGDGTTNRAWQAQAAFGVRLSGALSSHNTLVGNKVGTADGSTPLGDLAVGLMLENAPMNDVGLAANDPRNYGRLPGPGNVIVAAGKNSVDALIVGPVATGNHLAGNVFGSPAAPGSGTHDGVDVLLAGGNIIDGKNQVLGYTRYGVYLSGSWTTENTVSDNDIGGPSGMGGVAGVALNNAPDNTFLGNRIVHNATGVVLAGGQTRGNEFHGNSVTQFRPPRPSPHSGRRRGSSRRPGTAPTWSSAAGPPRAAAGAAPRTPARRRTRAGRHRPAPVPREADAEGGPTPPPAGRPGMSPAPGRRPGPPPGRGRPTTSVRARPHPRPRARWR